MNEFLGNLDISTAIIVTVSGWVFSAFVQSIPNPEEEDGKGYKFFYKFAHTLAANYKVVQKENKREKYAENSLGNN